MRPKVQQGTNYRVELCAGAISTLRLVRNRDASEEETRVTAAPERNHVAEDGGEAGSVNSYPLRGIWRSRAILQRITPRCVASIRRNGQRAGF